MIYFCLSGFLFISIIGFVLHMFYDVADKNKALRFLFAVNNSPWEQIKLAFFPTIVWGLISILLGINNAMFVLFIALISEIVVFTLLFYFTQGITKKQNNTVDLVTFFVSVLVSMLICYFVFKAKNLGLVVNIVGLAIAVIIVVCYGIFSYKTPHFFLFKDSTTGKYGASDNE